VKIFVAALEALRKKKRGGQNRMKLCLPQKKWCISNLLMLMHFFAGFFCESHLVLDQTQGSGAVFC